jgi:ribosomal protein L30E
MNKALNYLSLARKAGAAELGEEPVGGAARAGKAYLIIVAADCGDHSWRRAKSYAAGTDQQAIRLSCTKDEMGLATGRTSLAMAAITDVALALALCEHYLQGKGAYRVHGGGFAGTVQAFVPFEILESFRAGIDGALGEGSCHVLSIRPQGGVEMEQR